MKANLDGIRLQTKPSGSGAGQHIIVYAIIDGVEREVIRSWGALTDITIDHFVTDLGIERAFAECATPRRPRRARREGVERMPWRYQPVWITDAAGTAFGLCEVHLHDDGRLKSWTARWAVAPTGDSLEDLSGTIARMMVDAWRWKPVSFGSMQVGMTFERMISPEQAEELATEIEGWSNGMSLAATPQAKD